MVTREDFKAYREVQMESMFNMHTKEAQEATGLDKETYQEIIAEYTQLREMYPDVEKECIEEFKQRHPSLFN